MKVEQINELIQISKKEEHALPYDGYSPEENTERLLSLIKR